MAEQKTGIEIIAEARRHQIEDEGFYPAGDTQYTDRELARAALCYMGNAVNGGKQIERPAPMWPWPLEWWRPTTPIKDLAKAGALVAAEIDRRIAAGESVD